MGKKRGVTLGGAEPIAVVPAKAIEEESDLETEQPDGSDLSISSDETGGSGDDGAEESEEEGHDAELRDALLDYQTTAARLRDEEASGRTNEGRSEDDEPG